MTIFVVKTCDGPVYYRDTVKGQNAALKLLEDQLMYHPEAFDLSQDSADEIRRSFHSIGDALREGYIQRVEVRND